MADERDPPIQEQEYRQGVTVVDLGDVRVARGMTRRNNSTCSHKSLVYDLAERRIWCKDCEHDVEAFDAFKLIVENYDAALKTVASREAAVSEAARFQVRSRAAKKIDEAWRSKTMVPACPHCNNGLFPEDLANGFTMLGRDFAIARQRKSGQQPSSS